jgi:LPXTG-site transpeptidase (sortase) family protein
MRRFLSKPRRPSKQIILAVLGLLVVALALALAIRTGTKPPTHLKNKPAAQTIIEPVSEKPVTKDTYVSKALPDEPKHLDLPSIGAAGFIEKVGVLSNGQIQAPGNIDTAGWYKTAGTPGQPGLSILDGHVDGPTRHGIFYNLHKLRTGDEFSLEKGDGMMLRYKVMSVNQYPADESVNYLFSQDPSVNSQLNLITCGGNFDKQSETYKQRIIVTASLTP